MSIENEIYTKVQQFMIYLSATTLALLASLMFGSPELIQLTATLAYAYFALIAFNLKNELKRLKKLTSLRNNSIKYHLKNLNFFFYIASGLMLAYRTHLVVVAVRDLGI